MTEADFDVERLIEKGGLAHVEHHERLTSTNDRARDIAREHPALAAALVIAQEQTAGRGRGANRWWTGRGSLACSLLFDPAARGIRREDFALVSLATAVAIVESLRPLLPACELGLHWPNDVFARGRKLAGILVEALPDGKHIVGVGLNVNNYSADAPADVRARATSIAELTEREHSRTELLLALLNSLWPRLDQLAADAAVLAREADQVCLQHGRTLMLESGPRRVEGLCAGIADDGALVLRTERGNEKFYSGVLIHA